MEKSITILRKFKKHEREALLPLYQKHVNEYLIRIVAANVDKVHVLMDKIHTFYEFATCHEVAFNVIFGLNLATHQNPLGFEAKYTNHPEAKYITRKYRVQYIWAYLFEQISENPTFSGIEPLNLRNDLTRCPFCNQPFYRKLVVGLHLDGTKDFNFEWVDVHADHMVWWTNSYEEIFTYLDQADVDEKMLENHNINPEDWLDGIQEVVIPETGETVGIADLDDFFYEYQEFLENHPEDCKICFDEE